LLGNQYAVLIPEMAPDSVMGGLGVGATLAILYLLAVLVVFGLMATWLTAFSPNVERSRGMDTFSMR
jgi:hypothetical protein